MERKILLLLLPFLPVLGVLGQNFSGQWKGEFIDKSAAIGNFSGDKCDYVIELDVDGTNVTGSTYTYFSEGGKRFYTICKLEGFIDYKNKYIEFEEVSRIKTNIPSNIRNCFQTHRLTYFKKGDLETLEGKWNPAPNQQPGCGFGTTLLSKRTLNNSFSGRGGNKIKQTEETTATTPEENTSIKTNIKPGKKQKQAEKKINEIIESKDVTPESASSIDLTKESTKNNNPDPVETPKLEKRKTNVIKTIEVENSHIDVDFYDNGEIDGDTISVYYNSKLILSRKKLTDRPLHMVLDMDDDMDVNELTMYAENLGTIPPNSAVMVIRDGPNRYEVRISSDLNNSGVVRFKHMKKDSR